MIPSYLIGFYVTAILAAVFLAAFGPEGVERLSMWITMEIRYAFLKMRMKWMEIKLKRDLDRIRKEIEHERMKD